MPATEPPPAGTGVAGALTRRLTASTGVADAVAATREVLARGGIATWDGQRFLAEATAPAAAGFAIPEETVILAMEARQRPTAGHLTLAQLGDMLKDLGWPFPEGRIPGELLREVFRGWVSDGLAQPNDPLSFTPLFLREMALTQQPAVDLAQGDYDPEHLHLTLLELELFAAHFDRLAGPAAKTSWNKAPGLAMPAAQDAAPCSEARQWLDSAFNDAGQAAVAVAQIVASDGVGQGLKEALQAAGITEAGAELFGKALSALSIASRFLKLMALYTQAQVAVTVVGANPIHAPSGSEARLWNGFQARAGVSDQDWQEYQQSMTSSDVLRGLRDCYSYHGLPVIPDLGDMGKEAKDWHVEWRLEGAPEWVRINEADNAFVHPGILRTNLEADGDHSAAALLTVEILPETGKTHSGPQKQARAVASAALHTAKPPSIATWVNALKGGLGDVLALSDALVELGAGWIAEALPPKAYAGLTVTYHESEAASWSGRVTYERTKTVNEFEAGTTGDGYAAASHSFEYFCQTVTVQIGSGKVLSKSYLQDLWNLSGFAMVIVENEDLDEGWAGSEGCEGKGVLTRHERSYSRGGGSGSGPVTGSLVIRPVGTYALSFASLPEVTGEQETEWDFWSENAPCLDDRRHNESTVPLSVYGYGATISVTGKLDPENPGALSGRYEVIDPGGYTVKITWNLRQES